MWDIITGWFLSIFTKEFWLGEKIPGVEELNRKISNLEVWIGKLKIELKARHDEIVRDAVVIYDSGRRERKTKKENIGLKGQIMEIEIKLRRVMIELRRKRKDAIDKKLLDKIRMLRIEAIRLQKTVKGKDGELKEKSSQLITALGKIERLEREISDLEIKKNREIEQLKEQAKKRVGTIKKLRVDLEKATIELRRRRKEQASDKTNSGIGPTHSLILMLIFALILIVPLPTTDNQTSNRIETAETEIENRVETEIPIICIDPGHEGIGINTGTQGIDTDVPEYEVNLEIALELKEALEDQGMKVVMTRKVDKVRISNWKRVQMANRAQADLFLLIHCNGSKNPEKNGSEVYYPPDKEVGIYWKSKEAARLILEELSKIDRGRLGRLAAAYENMDQRVCCGNSYLILKHSKVPVVLIEIGYLTNPQEDRLLNSEDYQKKVAVAISNAVVRYLLNNGWKITKTSGF